MSTLIKLIGYSHIHLEIMKGSILENERYCQKEGDFSKLGLPFIGKGGNRNIQEFHKLIKEGKSDIQLAEHDFSLFSRCLKAIDRIRLACKPERSTPRSIVLYEGYTGSGKTRKAIEDHVDLYELPTGKDIWFDAYYLNKTALFDEFTGQMPLNQTLRVVCDYNVVKVPIKGGFVWFNPDTIILTSNIHPMHWYDYKGRIEQEKALRRRFTSIIKFNQDGTMTNHDTKIDIENYWVILGDKPHFQQSINDDIIIKEKEFIIV